jgi:hypothetical protein
MLERSGDWRPKYLLMRARRLRSREVRARGVQPGGVKKGAIQGDGWRCLPRGKRKRTIFGVCVALGEVTMRGLIILI